MKKYIKIYSPFVGVGIGFLNFYVLSFSWEISWDGLDIDEAKEISDAIEEFKRK